MALILGYCLGPGEIFLVPIVDPDNELAEENLDDGQGAIRGVVPVPPLLYNFLPSLSACLLMTTFISSWQSS